MVLIDDATEIRKGEKLPHKKLEAFILDQIKDINGTIRIRQFPKGHSNLTYLVSAGDKQMVLRCPPHGTKAKSAHDMGREYRMLSALKGVYPYCPEPLLYTEDETIIGAPFYLMERINGIIIRETIPKELKLSVENTRRLFEAVFKAQYELHAIDYKKIGLENFGKPEGYIERQVKGWIHRYESAKTKDTPDARQIMDWLLKYMPNHLSKAAIIHNDFKFDNVILDPENPLKVIGVLDWEMATIGDPLMDFGASIGYWVQPGDPDGLNAFRDVPSNAPGALSRKEMVTLYETLSGRKIDHFSFYHTFGVFRLAVIAQQIFYRYFHGQTQDERFKTWDLRVKNLIRLADQIIHKAD